MELKNKRMFAFGCSLTYYNYPTWADIIGSHYGVYENWGKPGQGNNFILNSIVECDKRNTFTSDDDIFVMWTSIDRIDMYQFNTWTNYNNKYPHNNPLSSCPKGYQIISNTAKILANNYLTSKKSKVVNMDWFDSIGIDDEVNCLYYNELKHIKSVQFEFNRKKFKRTDYNDYLDFVTKLYERIAGPTWPTLNQILNSKYDYEINDPYIKKEIDEFKERIKYHSDWDFNSVIEDSHPTPAQHLKFVKEYFPNFKISSECISWVNRLQHQIENGTYKGFTPFSPKERF